VSGYNTTGRGVVQVKIEIKHFLGGFSAVWTRVIGDDFSFPNPGKDQGCITE
jgi:hypothetical protein